MTVKIVAADRVVGVVVVESFEREYAFGPSEVRLLQTIVASMGVALENALWLFGGDPAAVSGKRAARLGNQGGTRAADGDGGGATRHQQFA